MLGCASKKGRPPCSFRKAAKVFGLSYYFSGKLCVRGHLAKRFTISGMCVECKNEWERKNRAANGATPKIIIQMRKQTPEQVAINSRANVKRWRKRNPDKKLAHQRRRRAGMTGFVTPDHVALLRAKQDAQCFYCAGLLEPETFDHFIPISLSGEHCIDNGRLACNVCNAKKCDMLPRDFFIKVWNSLE